MKKLLACLAVLPACAFAQQVVKPPIAQYWMSIETAAGMSMPGMGAMMGGMMGGQSSSGRRMLLQLGSQQSASDPRAAHEIPPGMNMGPLLPLVTPRSEPVRRGEPGERGERERPRGRMLVYWGCGDAVRAGQPVVIDFAKLAEGAVPPGFSGRRIAQATGPAYGRSRTYGDWPNAEDSKPVPDSASLRGSHVVKGNYSPEIRFPLERDFMDRVSISAAGNRVSWGAVGGATGYFATVMGGRGQDEVVFWSSSETQEWMGSGLMDWIAPGEVARLVREKVVLAPQVTDCTVPGEVIQKVGTGMMQFIAYGDEVNLAHPPRPQDPKVAWEPQWAVKARFKSTASLLVGEGAEERGSRRGARDSRDAPPSQDAPSGERSQTPSAPDPVKEGVQILRGIFGR